MNARTGIGVDVGPTNIKIARVVGTDIAAKDIFPTWPDETRSIDLLLDRILQHLSEFMTDECTGCGIAWSTGVRPHDGIPIPFRHWSDYTVEELGEIVSLKERIAFLNPAANITIEKDANMDAVAVHATEGISNAAIVNIGTDITGAYISPSGAVAFGVIAEFGNMIVSASPLGFQSPWLPPGAFSDAASASAIKAFAQKRGIELNQEPASLAPLAGDGEAVFELSRWVARAVAVGISEIIAILEPAHMRITGGVVASDFGAQVMKLVAAEVPGLDIAISRIDPMFAGAAGAAIHSIG